MIIRMIVFEQFLTIPARIGQSKSFHPQGEVVKNGPLGTGDSRIKAMLAGMYLCTHHADRLDVQVSGGGGNLGERDKLWEAERGRLSESGMAGCLKPGLPVPSSTSSGWCCRHQPPDLAPAAGPERQHHRRPPRHPPARLRLERRAPEPLRHPWGQVRR